MTAVSDDRLVGATIWQQELFDVLVAHERDEEEVISAYEVFAERAPSDAVRYLVRLILDDEKRETRACGPSHRYPELAPSALRGGRSAAGGIQGTSAVAPATARRWRTVWRYEPNRLPSQYPRSLSIQKARIMPWARARLGRGMVGKRWCSIW